MQGIDKNGAILNETCDESAAQIQIKNEMDVQMK